MEIAIARHVVVVTMEVIVMSLVASVPMDIAMILLLERVFVAMAGLGQLVPRQTVQTPEQYLVVMAVEHAMGPVTVLAIQDGATHIVLRVLMVGRVVIVMSLIVLA